MRRSLTGISGRVPLVLRAFSREDVCDQQHEGCLSDPYLSRGPLSEHMDDLELISPPAPEPDPEPGYYRAQAATGDIAADSLVYLLAIDQSLALVLVGEKQYHIKRPAFLANFVFDPQGATARQAEMLALMIEISELQAAGAASNRALAGLNPHLGANGALSGMEVVPASGSTALEAKRSIAMIHNEAAKVRLELEARQSAIRAMAEEQAIILRRQAAALTEILGRAEEAVWTINLYLGEDEHIVRLAEGSPAPADTPITIRQLVLFMDEECAVAAEDGGIDARAIDKFDEWLLADPAHLAQLLPEIKGMVALKPRRTSKDYRTGDAWSEAKLNEDNKVTYFLLRNGANLYRMWTKFDVGERLIPRTDEFVGYFSERRYNYETGKHETIRLDPGSDSFMNAEKKASAGQRHYMRAALILQGLIDRTTVFRPLAEKINVGDQASYRRALAVVLDADTVLSDGRERFADWFARINGQLAVGMRIVGAFNSWEHGLHQYERERSGGNARISPEHAAYPSSDALYTLAERRSGGFVFFFERTGEWREYEQRAACVVKPDDDFILNFDAATSEEMEFYLASRLDRSNYTYLFPTLKLALRHKRLEAAAEAPFALLLAGQIALAHQVSVAEATAAVPELITWFKFKNRTHRALTSDDARALRMIVAEFGLRRTQSAVRANRSAEAETMVAAIRAAEPNALLIAHKAGAEYVALLPANDENIFVAEQVWTTRGRKEVKSWRTVDNRHQRWQILYTSPRWADWQIGADPRTHLTDEERAALIKAGWAALSVRRHWRNDPPIVRHILPLAATVTDQGELELYFADEPAELPSENLLSNHARERALARASLHWKREGGLNPQLGSMPESHLSFGRDDLPWEKRYDGRPYAGRVLWSDPAALAAFREERAAAALVQARAAGLAAQVSYAWNALEKQYLANQEAAAYAKFIADFGDPDLWVGHKKSLTFRYFRSSGVRSALERLVERFLPIEGLTVGEILEQAQALTGKTYSAEEDVRALRVPFPEPKAGPKATAGEPDPA